MGRLFFRVCLLVLGILIFFFTPIFIKTDSHYDMNRKKLGFSLFIFGFIKILGGYIGTYKGGLALHLSEKKAILVPYNKLNSERKRFSFIKTFRIITFNVTIETGAEYLLPISLTQTLMRTYFLSMGGDVNKIKNNLWLTDGDVLRISLRSVLAFNLYILIKNFIKFIKEKIKILWRKKTRKSTA